ncbi:hypothetical protein RchiOBHm_Chr7g0193281 [Rosa chinensis]|uniref:Uncharacterized protein n=1 Tax=Rosa chinensis TaxID=74649 RepID=A0A2P6P5U6_ROSCH|nr:hypothetical protein RchiOBHm_Chr7g0193281 [Rosa chinensis]
MTTSSTAALPPTPPFGDSNSGTVLSPQAGLFQSPTTTSHLQTHLLLTTQQQFPLGTFLFLIVFGSGL